MLDLSVLGVHVAAALKAKQWSQAELARKAGVSRATIDLLENERAREIGFSKLARILAAVGLELTLRTRASKRPTLDDLMKENADD